MSLLNALASLLRELFAYVWFTVVGPRVNDPDEPRLFRVPPSPERVPHAVESAPPTGCLDYPAARTAMARDVDVRATPMSAAGGSPYLARRHVLDVNAPIGGAQAAADVVASAIRADVPWFQEDVMAGSFLSQLEQRTQQVKITLANLEAEKTRIEGLIGQIQPMVPHYDALLEAERSLSEAQVQFEDLRPDPSAEQGGGASQEEPVWENGDSQSEDEHQERAEHHSWDQ